MMSRIKGWYDAAITSQTCSDQAPSRLARSVSSRDIGLKVPQSPDREVSPLRHCLVRLRIVRRYFNVSAELEAHRRKYLVRKVSLTPRTEAFIE